MPKLRFWEKPKWKEYSQKKYANEVHKLAEYKKMKQLMGELYADQFVELVFKKQGGDPARGKGAGHFNKAQNQADFWKLTSKFIQNEQSLYLDGHYQIGRLMVSANSGSLRTGLANGAMQPVEYGAGIDDDDVTKAAKWLCNESTSLSQVAYNDDAPINVAKVTAAMREIVDDYSVLSLDAIMTLHEKVYQKQPHKVSRGPHFGVKYCSTVGGWALLDKTFEMAKSFKDTPEGDAKWEDIACFLLGSVIRSHGFVDGNGRAGRGLYACALIQGGRPFVPATYAKVTELTALK